MSLRESLTKRVRHAFSSESSLIGLELSNRQNVVLHREYRNFVPNNRFVSTRPTKDSKNCTVRERAGIQTIFTKASKTPRVGMKRETVERKREICIIPVPQNTNRFSNYTSNRRLFQCFL